MLLVALSMTACLREIDTKPPPEDKPPVESDADTDADTDADSDADADSDTDSDADTDPVDDEDCGNGKDDDKDGLTDCEDEDCVDVCIEDCDNDKDDDGDGDVDCADDECFGTSDCLDVWRVTANVFEGHASVAYGEAVEDWYGHSSMAFFDARVELSAENGRGDSFECDGFVNAGPPAWGYHGMAYTSSSCGGCDFSFDFAPRSSKGSLGWFSDCPVPALPTMQLGFRSGKEKITSDMGAGWVNQYVGSGAYWGWDDNEYGVIWGGLYELEPQAERTWIGTYE
jgi:hypothetical protein